MRVSNSFRVNNVEKCTTKLKPGGLGGGGSGEDPAEVDSCVRCTVQP